MDLPFWYQLCGVHIAATLPACWICRHAIGVMVLCLMGQQKCRGKCLPQSRTMDLCCTICGMDHIFINLLCMVLQHVVPTKRICGWMCAVAALEMQVRLFLRCCSSVPVFWCPLSGDLQLQLVVLCASRGCVQCHNDNSHVPCGTRGPSCAGLAGSCYKQVVRRLILHL